MLPSMHLLLYMSIVFTAFAAYLPLRPRMDDCEKYTDNIELAFLDAPTTDGTAGIGVEFESPAFTLKHDGCSKEDTDDTRKKIIGRRQGKNFMLTADTGASEVGGKVQAEYILDGTQIKVGDGSAAAAAKAAADDLIDWKPWQQDWPVNVNIAESKCNPWQISGPSKKTDPNDLPWVPQVTAPMPLEALYRLMKESEDNPASTNPLVGVPLVRPNYLIVVTQDFFRDNKNSINSDEVKDDVLGFCSLVLSYAKAAATDLIKDESPKLRTAFMPRTEFATIFRQVKSKIPGDLYTLFTTLACWKKDKNGNIVLDNDFCSASGSPTGKLDTLKYSNPKKTVNIKTWIQNIASRSPSPGVVDDLSDFDKSIDGSIGGLDVKMEKMYKSQRSVPLFEFRDLIDKKTSEMEKYVGDVDSEIQTLHNKFANPQQKKRQDFPSSCFADQGSSTSSTPLPSCYLQNEDPDQGIYTRYCVCESSRTLPLLTISPTVVVTSSCQYTSLPPKTKRDVTTASPKETKRAAIPVATLLSPEPTITPSPNLAGRDLTISTGFGPPTTDTKNCQVCTRVVVNEDSCSSMPNCIVQSNTLTIEAGSSSVHLGDLTGTALYTSVSSALSKLCPTPVSASPTSCATSNVKIKDIPYDSGGFLGHGELVVSVESSQYNQTDLLTGMFNTAAKSFQQGATGRNCYTAHYEVMKKRSWIPSIFSRDVPHAEPESATWCNTPGFTAPHFYNPYWRLQPSPGASAYLDARLEFTTGKGGGDFDCAILEDAELASAFLGPEWAIADTAIVILCELATSSKRAAEPLALPAPGPNHDDFIGLR